MNTTISFLRLLAIVLVTFFHAKVPGFQYGFLGVDVFLVISGIVLSKSITQLKNFQNYIRFLTKRYVRLFPQSCLVLVLSVLILMPVSAPEYIDTMIQHSIAGLFFLNNVLLYLTTGYWSTSNSFNPLFHLWSLSLELQLYFICAIYFFAKGKIEYLIPLSLLLLYFSYAINSSYHAFYLLPNYRLWEFALGVVAGVSYKNKLIRLQYVICFAFLIFMAILYDKLLLMHTAAVFLTLLAYHYIKDAKISRLDLSGSYRYQRIVYAFYLLHVPFFTGLNILSISAIHWIYYLSVTPIIVAFSYTISDTSRFILKVRSNMVTFFGFTFAFTLLVGLVYFNEPHYKMLYKDEYFSRSDGRELNELPRKFSFRRATDVEGKVVFVGDSFARDLFNMMSTFENSDNLTYFENFAYECDKNDLSEILHAGFAIFTRRNLPIDCYLLVQTVASELGKDNYAIIGPKSFGDNPNKVYNFFSPHVTFINAPNAVIEDIQSAQSILGERFYDLYSILEPKRRYQISARDYFGNATTFDLIHFSRPGIHYYAPFFQNWWENVVKR